MKELDDKIEEYLQLLQNNGYEDDKEDIYFMLIDYINDLMSFLGDDNDN